MIIGIAMIKEWDVLDSRDRSWELGWEQIQRKTS